MQCEKQFSFTFEIRYLALLMLDCWARAVVMRAFSWEGSLEAELLYPGEGEGCCGDEIVGEAREERSVVGVLLVEEEEDGSLEPPKPKTMVAVVRGWRWSGWRRGDVITRRVCGGWGWWRTAARWVEVW